MVDLEKLAELDKRATGAPWEWETYASPDGPRVPQGSYLGTTLITLGDRYEGCDEDCALVAELRNQCASMIAELRAARGLAASLRRSIDNRWPVTDDELVKYEAARDGGGK